jgi:hypothetical protein
MTIRRRARDADGREIPPMTLANMREHGVRSIEATCRTCQHSARLNVDGWPADVPVPDVGLGLVCSACGGKEIETRPDWREFNPLKGWMAPGTFAAISGREPL